MNWYGHYIGDWLKKTSDISLLQEGVYRRLLDWYYANERPLPLAMRDCCSIARCRNKRERDAVSTVVHRFFTLTEQGWHNQRADSELESFSSDAPQREHKKALQKVRQQRARERRSAVFEELRKVGVVPRYNAPMRELDELLQRHGVTLKQYGDVTRDEGRDVTRDDTDENPQPPYVRETTSLSVTQAVTAAGAACRAMRKAGLADANPGHLQLLRLLDAGVTVETLRGAAIEAAVRKKGFAYALTIAQSWHEKGAPGAAGARQARDQGLVEAWAPALVPGAPEGLA